MQEGLVQCCQGTSCAARCDHHRRVRRVPVELPLTRHSTSNAVDRVESVVVLQLCQEIQDHIAKKQHYEALKV